jgi:hypothetical protein
MEAVKEYHPRLQQLVAVRQRHGKAADGELQSRSFLARKLAVALFRYIL